VVEAPANQKVCHVHFQSSHIYINIYNRGGFVIGGWIAVALLSWKVLNTVTDNKVYDPFEILGISSVRAIL
jgi:preprotein translocase subunit Sec63